MQDSMIDTIITFLSIYLSNEPDWKQVLLTVMTPVFLVSLFVEYVIMKRRGATRNFHLKDILANFSLGAAYQLFEIAYYFLFLSTAVSFAFKFRLFDFEMTGLAWIFLIFGVEFFYYWFHRANHRIRWFWCAHVVHHSSEHMNMSTAMRQSVTYTVNLSYIFWVPLIIMGFEPWAVFLMLATNLSYQYFIHTESIGKLHPVIEYIFNTPSHHRAHHGRNPEYIDKNFGGVVIVFDRLFGTFIEEHKRVEYGIPRRIMSYNFIKLNLHEWQDMFSDFLKPGPFFIRFKHLWAPPEWTRKPQSNELNEAKE